MPLLANRIGLAEPLVDAIVELIRRFDPELVNVVSRRDRLDSAKPWVFQAASQDHMPVEPVLLEHQAGEAHSDLEGNARLLGQVGDRTAVANHIFKAAVRAITAGDFPAMCSAKV